MNTRSKRRVQTFSRIQNLKPQYLQAQRDPEAQYQTTVDFFAAAYQSLKERENG